MYNVRRYATLDAWRGIACLFVVFSHSVVYTRAYPAPAGAYESAANKMISVINWMVVGVPMFFVISGYCVTAAAHTASARSHHFATYMKRRAWRIYPPYLCMIAVTASAVLAAWQAGLPSLFSDERYPIPHPLALTWDQWLGNLTLTESWRARLAGAPHRSFVVHAWSLCYEEQFYLLTGLSLLLLGPRLGLGLVAVTLVTLAVILLKVPINGFFFDGHWLQFAAGSAVFYVIHTPRRGLKGGLVIALLGCITGTFVFRSSQWIYFTEFVTTPTFALLLLVLFRWDGVLGRWRPVGLLCWVGRMSYSLYLIHWLVCKGVTHGVAMCGVVQGWPALLTSVPLATAASVLAGLLFHRLVERYFLNPPLGPSAEAAPKAAPARGRPETHDSRAPAAPSADRPHGPAPEGGLEPGLLPGRPAPALTGN